MHFFEAAFNIANSDTGTRSVYSQLRRKLIFWHPFGWEYAQSPRWKLFERIYIRLFGLVDLPARMRARLITKALRCVRWKTMLDFGSGTGAYSFYFSRSPAVHVCGVDIHKTRIDECLELRQRLERKSLDFVVSSRIFETNRFQPNSMDVVLAIEVLPYLFDVPAGFQEIQQVLKPGGYLIGHIPLLGYRQKPETFRFDTDTFARLTREAGLELISIDRVFGSAARLLSWIYGYCAHSRLCTAFAFPLLLTASFACGGKDSRGSHCLLVARKPPKRDESINPSSQKTHLPPSPKP